MVHAHRWLIGTLVGIVLAAALALIGAAGTDSLAANGIIYVDWEAMGAGNGVSWAHAYTGLQPALDAATAGDQIWVAAGTYLPSVEHGGSGDRYRSFQMRNGVVLYGGFDPSAGATGFWDRDWGTYRTILSGDLNGDDGPDFANNSENSYHVFYHPSGTDLNATAILDGFTITAGHADGDGDHNAGGGMHNHGASPALANCTFSGNAAGSGGGMYNNGSSPMLRDCAFYGNYAWQVGGGMSNSGSSPNLINCAFTENRAGFFSGIPWSGCGGGMHNAGSSVTLTHCTFTDNRASAYCRHPSSYGGGMCNSGSSLTLTHCTFRSNTASCGDGGGMYNRDSSLTLTDCVFEENASSSSWLVPAGSGGGMYNWSSLLTLKNCTFSGNEAIEGEGGGMNNLGSSLTLTNCTFSGNHATYTDGGGLYNEDASLALVNCTFENNTASGGSEYGFGGGMHNMHTSPGLTNCTFTGNQASHGGAISSADPFSPTLTNCILWHDTPDEIYGAATVNYSDVEGGHNGVGNIDADPLFLDPAGGDYHLTPGSPCIDAGTNDAPHLPLFDFEGDDRIVDSGDPDGRATVDMGVDEVIFLEVTSDSPTRLGHTTTLTATPVRGGQITPTWNYTWAFGDAGFGTGSVVAHTYLTVGQYAAELTATHMTSLVQDTTIVTVYQPYPLYLPLAFWNQ